MLAPTLGQAVSKTTDCEKKVQGIKESILPEMSNPQDLL